VAERFYSGTADLHVTVREDGVLRDLSPRLDLQNHSQSFAWGFGGSAPAQLALALIADATGDDARALRLQHDFKFRVIASLPSRWTMTQSRVLAYVAELEHAERTRATA
jgi:hypothetical protein